MAPGSARKGLAAMDAIVTRFRVREATVRAFAVTDAETHEQLGIIKAHLQSIWDNYSKLQNELINEPDANSQQYLCFERDYVQLLSHVNVLLKTSSHLAAVPAQERSLSPTSSVAPPQQVRLPEVAIPRFNGDYTTWIEFRDMFSAIIKDDPHIPEINKFYYLTQSLTGEARGVINNLPATAANFAVAWKSLSEQYDHKRIIAYSHLNNLDSPPAVEPNSAASLNKFLNYCKSNINALATLSAGESIADLVFTHRILSKLDRVTACEWERHSSADSHPKLQDLWDFLQTRQKVLEISAVSDLRQTNPPLKPLPGPPPPRQRQAVSDNGCAHCSAPHPLHSCPAFKALGVESRMSVVKSRGLCFNCLRTRSPNHGCSQRRCFHCGRSHHSLLHGSVKFAVPRPTPAVANHTRAATAQRVLTVPPEVFQPSSHDDTSQTPVRDGPAPQEFQPASHACSTARASSCILPTAMLNATDAGGQYHQVTALLDSGSTCNLITRELMLRLDILETERRINIRGICSISKPALSTAIIQLSSRLNGWIKEFEFVVVDSISDKFPAVTYESSEWCIPSGLLLADPSFHKPRPLDMLLGISITSETVEPGIIRLGDNQPVLTNTKFGWTVHGAYSPASAQASTTFSAHFVSDDQLSTQLQRFWETENLPERPTLTPEEAACEDHFSRTTSRDPAGRYQVELPLRDAPPPLGQSRAQATRRFSYLEKRFARDPSLEKSYKQFMKEYLQLGHMSAAPPVNPATPHYFIPHHPVTKVDGESTKLRVVFDASARTTTGVSLNDTLLTGPTVQSDLWSILIRFRLWPIALVADCEKMYRQVVMSPSCRDYQRIIWRSSPDEPLAEYQLNTVTYGLSSSSFQATRVLNQLATEEASGQPNAKRAIQCDHYVDDLLTGADSIETAAELAGQIMSALKRGGFSLRKWRSNAPQSLADLPDDSKATTALKPIAANDSCHGKALGMTWDSSRDTLRASAALNIHPRPLKTTKRNVLSAVSQVWDPLGVISPLVIRAKIFFQSLWQNELDWDQALPTSLQSQWDDIRPHLINTSSVQFPRCVRSTANPMTLQLHGFSDASLSAYGACIYVRSVHEAGVIESNLLCAKSKVAPLKCLTVFRLELCAALLLARMMAKVVRCLTLSVHTICLWTDSESVRAVIRSPPARRVVFVSSRVAEIQDLTNPDDWHHVSTKENPADIISRGTTATALAESPLWWHGPHWLLSSELICSHTASRNVSTYSTTPPDSDSFRICIVFHAMATILKRSSVFSQIIRTIAWCLRWRKIVTHQGTSPIGPLTIEELAIAESRVIKSAQSECFAPEIRSITLTGEVSHKSPISPLSPFLHRDGTLRVGGRLTNAPLPFDMRHQILLPANHKLTRLLIEAIHHRLLHAGTQMVMANFRERYWTPQLRRTVRNCLRTCIPCKRKRADCAEQMMGDLPAVRVTPSPPFQNCGVDYAGPLLVKQGGPRSRALLKSYLAIYTCFATRAIHVEIVSSLTTKDFLASFSRFVSRRGMPHKIFSDNAANFRRADKELSELHRFMENSLVQDTIKNSATRQGIRWYFIPARSPHFGGVWESAVNMFKNILRPAMRNKTLTLEELNTLAIQVEAILNSRPLCPISEDPDSFEFLSPGHFLIGRPLTALPIPPQGGENESHPSRWRKLQTLVNQLWQRWTQTYILSLQRKQKWHSASKNIKVGTVVLLKDDNLPPCSWRMGRVTDTYPGRDGRIRVVQLKTATGSCKRGIHYLCPLLEPDQHTLHEQRASLYN